MLRMLAVQISFFFFIFSTRLSSGIHLGMAGMFVLLVVLREHVLNVKIPKNISFVMVFLLVVSGYDLIMTQIYDHDPFAFFTIPIFAILYIIMGAIAQTAGFTVLDFLKLYFACVLVNSTICISEFFIPPFKNFIESLLMNDANANISFADHAFRMRGLSANGGASLSVASWGATWIGVCLAIKKELNPFFTLFACAIITCSCIFMGRTGLILSLFTMMFFLIYLIYNSFCQKNLKNLIYVFSFFFVMALAISTIDFDSEVLGWAFEWFNNYQSSGSLESSSTTDLQGMIYLPDSWSGILFGFGFFEGNSRFVVRSDVGYLKTLLSVGMLLGVSFYAVVIYVYGQIGRSHDKLKFLIYSLIIVLLFVEVKEPFFYQNYLARVLFFVSGMAIIKNKTQGVKI